MLYCTYLSHMDESDVHCMFENLEHYDFSDLNEAHDMQIETSHEFDLSFHVKSRSTIVMPFKAEKVILSALMKKFPHYYRKWDVHVNLHVRDALPTFIPSKYTTLVILKRTQLSLTFFDECQCHARCENFRMKANLTSAHFQNSGIRHVYCNSYIIENNDVLYSIQANFNVICKAIPSHMIMIVARGFQTLIDISETNVQFLDVHHPGKEKKISKFTFNVPYLTLRNIRKGIITKIPPRVTHLRVISAHHVYIANEVLNQCKIYRYQSIQNEAHPLYRYWEN